MIVNKKLKKARPIDELTILIKYLEQRFSEGKSILNVKKEIAFLKMVQLEREE